MSAKIYEDPYSVRHRDRRRRLFSLGSKSTFKASSTKLRRPFLLSMRQHCPVNVSFECDDKLIIIFAYQKKFVVYKKSNGTVAVLENVTFKQTNPPMMFDGANLGALLHKLELKLMYAVAEKAYSEPKGIQFHQNDVILILAHCREIFLGITKDQRVGFFPPETVNIITNPKPCFFEGMTLAVTGVINFLGEDQKELSVYEKQDYEITKGRDGLFDWFSSNHLQVPLHAVSESGMTGMTMPTYPHLPSSDPPPLPPRNQVTRGERKLNENSGVTFDRDEAEEKRDSGLYDGIPDKNYLYAQPKKSKENKVKVFLNDLRCFHEVEFNDEMRQIVSQYIDDDVWHDLGRSLEIPKNTRIEIEKNKNHISGKTYDLLGQWHQKLGSQATLGLLLEALVSVNPEDLYLILEDLSYNLTSVYEDVL